MQIPENKLILEDLNAANRKFQLNKARLDYLEVKIFTRFLRSRL